MRIKRYRARDTEQAYQAIRADLGDEAVILQVQKVRDGGVLGLFRPPLVEVVAAGDSARAQTTTVDGAARLEALRLEVTGLRRQVAALAERASSELPLPSELRSTFERLIRLGVERALAQRLLAEVQEELSPRALADEALLGQALLRAAARRLRVVSPLRASARVPRTLFLIGPTGVGKTTTIAKLAASLQLSYRRRVALISTDTFRVGAVAQLRTFAEILGLPLHVAYDRRELVALLREQEDADHVLVDTPGCSQHNVEHLSELGEFIEAAQPAQVLLTLALPTALSETLEIARRFQVAPITGLVITKLDETSVHGSLLSLAEQLGHPFAYLTTGQQVPQDIERATPEGIAAWALGAMDAR